MVEQIILSPQVEGSVFVNSKLAYTSCLASCQRTSDLGSYNPTAFSPMGGLNAHTRKKDLGS